MRVALSLWSNALFPQDPGGIGQAPSCADYPFGRNITVTGHSRAYEVAVFTLPADYGSAIGDARLRDDATDATNVKIFAPGAVTGVQNLAWPGAQATDSAPAHWVMGLIISIFDSYLPKDNFWSVVVHLPEFLRNPMVHLNLQQTVLVWGISCSMPHPGTTGKGESRAATQTVLHIKVQITSY